MKFPKYSTLGSIRPTEKGFIEQSRSEWRCSFCNRVWNNKLKELYTSRWCKRLFQSQCSIPFGKGNKENSCFTLDQYKIPETKDRQIHPKFCRPILKIIKTCSEFCLIGIWEIIILNLKLTLQKQKMFLLFHVWIHPNTFFWALLN